MGKDLSELPPPPPPPGKRTGFPIAAGILAIIASCLALFIGMLFWGAVGLLWGFMGVFGITVFAFGLTGGIFSIRRRHFGLSIFGMSLLTLMGFFVLLVPALFGSPFIGLLFGIPIIIPSILSVIFAALSEGEFN